MSFTHILILVFVLVLVFGAKRIPEIGASIGEGIKKFKRSLSDAGDDDADRPPKVPPASTSSSVPSGGEPKRLSQ